MKTTSEPFGAGLWVAVGMHHSAGVNIRDEPIPEEAWVRCMDVDGLNSPISLPLERAKALHEALGKAIAWCDAMKEKP